MARRLSTVALLTAALLGMSACASNQAAVPAQPAPSVSMSGIVPGTRALATDGSGRQWDVTVMQAYFAASGRECLKVTFAAAGLPPSTNLSTACANGDQWVVATPVRTAERPTGAVPTSFTFNP